MNQKILIKILFVVMQSYMAASSGIIFQGMTESGVTKNTFLCGKSSVTAQLDSGSTVLADDCDMHEVQAAIGFDLSGGQTLQFFNNFTYWFKQQSQVEQNYQINTPQASDADIAAYMAQQEWVVQGAFSIIVSTNEILQKFVQPELQAKQGQTKLIVQLWYNGDNLIQLWSQDFALLQSGQGFTVAISNAADSRIVSLSSSGQETNTISSFEAILQPNNRNQVSYANAKDSPRMVRIQVNS